GVVQGSENIHKELDKYIIDKKIPYLGYTPDFDNNVEKIGEFCDKIDA
ncbi:MAG TPA: glycogen synthase, partial [Porphyromonadaceae bacterium]|nr:glycogen synthase [Porphyromonadaceae bacterium]